MYEPGYWRLRPYPIRSLLPVRAAHRTRRTRHADRLGGPHRRQGRVASPVRSYHLRGRCYDEYRRRERLPNAA